VKQILTGIKEGKIEGKVKIIIKQGGRIMSHVTEVNNYTVVDVETPNAMNNSICSIAVLHVKDNQVAYSKEYLVKPEASFDNYNMNINHINAQMVENAPIFPAVWEEIKHFITNGIVIAHNALFDLNVIGKTLNRYDIAVPDIHYICTLEKSRRHIPKERFGSHKLDALCDAFQIDLENHHNAMCDTNACKKLFDILSKEFEIEDSDIKTFRFQLERCANSAKKSVLQKAMNDLYGVIFGISCDKVIKKEENIAILNWMEENKEFKTDEEFGTCYNLLAAVLEDGIISKEEYYQLMGCISVHLSSNLYSDVTLSMQVLMGIIKGIAIDKKINIKEAKELYKWMEIHAALKGNYPFDKIFTTLEAALDNGVIDEIEEKNLLTVFKHFLNPEQIQENDIVLNGRVCCLTGTFTNGTKADVEKLINSKGGTCISGLNKSVDYLIVGGQGSSDWKYGNYGGKINKAVQMQEKGSAIQIVSEAALYN